MGGEERTDGRAEIGLDRAFAALADPIRRALVARLSRGPATVNELAEPFAISKQAVSRHIGVLEAAGLITRSRDAQRRPCHLQPAALQALTAWIDGYRQTTEQSFRRLDAVLGQTGSNDRHSTCSNQPPQGVRTMSDKAVTITAEPGTSFIDVTRTFDASPEALYRAYTDPGLVAQWLGPRELTMELGEYDVRPGGRWSYVHRDQDGNAYGFRGVFHDAVPNERIVQTFEFDGVPGHVTLEEVRFEEIDGGTRLTTHSAFQSVEDRDGMLSSGMEHGMTDSFERLEELLAGASERANA